MKQIPKFYHTFTPILEIIQNGETLHHREIRAKVRDKFYSKLPIELLAQKTSTGNNTLLDRIGWGVSYLNLAAYLERPQRGYYKITEKGLKVLEKGSLSLNELKKQPAYLTHQENLLGKKQISHQEIKEGDTPTDMIDKGISEIQEEVNNQLLEKIRSIDPVDFENVILELLNVMGYGQTISTKKTNDGGIDGVVNEDRFGLEKIYIQTKRFGEENKVREKDIRNFIGAMSSDTTKGIFVTTSKFDQKAIEKAEKAHHKIKLIDGEELVGLMYDYGIGVQVKSVIKIKEFDSNFFEK